MLFPWNRKLLKITYDLEEQARLRSRLAEHGLDYRIKTVNRQSPSLCSAGTRAHTGSFGINPAFSYQYLIYVKKEDYEAASRLLSELARRAER